MPLKQVLGFVEDGSFWPRVHNRIRQKTHLYHVLNHNAQTLCEYDETYAKLEHQYAGLLSTEKPRVPGPKPDTIWMCWLQGEQTAPSLVRACINSTRRYNPGREVVVLDNKTIPDYVELPGYLMDAYRRGRYSAAHFSDLLRTELLCTRGGAWMDATLLSTAPLPDYVNKAPLFAFKELDLTRYDKTPVVASSWFVSAAPNETIMCATRDLLWEYWRRERHLVDYFLFHRMFALSARYFPEEWDAVPTFNNHSPHVMQFELNGNYTDERWEQLTSMSGLHKLNHHDAFEDDGTTIYSHVLDTYLPK